MNLSLGKYISLNEKGFSLLRGGYTYHNISFEEIDHIRIRKGPYLRFSFLAFVVGIVMLFFGINQLLDLPLFDPHTTSAAKLFFIVLMLPVSLSLFGLLLLYQSLKRAIILELKVNGKTFWNPIDEAKDPDKLNELISVVKNTIPENSIELGPL